jgi:hypothetical protein
MNIQDIEDNKVKLRKQQTRLEKLADKILGYNLKKPAKSKKRKVKNANQKVSNMQNR